MNPKIAGFRTRAQLGLRAPRSRSTNITPERGGVAVHWGGPSQRLGSHARCEAIWRSWQDYHMDTHNWVDIAYTAAFCNHGYVLAGRGYGTRTAANGTNAGNQNYYAFVWIGGLGDTITTAALNALEWLVRDARSKGAGREVRPHRFFTGSTCPGPGLIGHSSNLHNTNITAPPPPAPKPEPEPVLDVRMEEIMADNRLLAIEGGGNTRYQLVADPSNPGKYALRVVPNPPVAVVLAGKDWRNSVVTLSQAQARALRIL